MSSNANLRARSNAAVRSSSLRSFSAADIEAARTLVSLSQGGSNRNPGNSRSSVNGRATATVRVRDVRTSALRVEDVALIDGGVANPFSLAHASTNSPAASSLDPMAHLAERLRSISLVHLTPPQIARASQRSPSGATGLPHVIRYHHCSETPEEVGRFVDFWDAHGLTPRGINDMLWWNNIVVPRQYILQRLGFGNGLRESDLRRMFGGGSEARTGTPESRSRHSGEDESDDDQHRRDSWESQLELWYEEH